jgi:hypothetical protein
MFVFYVATQTIHSSQPLPPKAPGRRQLGEHRPRLGNRLGHHLVHLGHLAYRPGHRTPSSVIIIQRVRQSIQFGLHGTLRH